MEGLYFKLYEKYDKIKKNKLSQLDELVNDQDAKFLNFVSAAEELISHLRNENEKLTTEVSDLKNEVASISSTNDEQCAMYQKLYMEESQKNKILSEEVDRLQKLCQLGPSCRSGDGKNKNSQLETPRGFEVTPANDVNVSHGRMTRKRTRQARIEAEAGMAVPVDNNRDVFFRESVKDQSNGTPSRRMSQLLECCQITIDRQDGGEIDGASANCPFHNLIEYLVGMKVSAATQTEGICISAVHQSSGYSFSLTWVNKEPGEELELLYRVSSLGTFERVAPEWMREVLMFSTRMCPIFFERVARVIKLHH